MDTADGLLRLTTADAVTLDHDQDRAPTPHVSIPVAMAPITDNTGQG